LYENFAKALLRKLIDSPAKNKRKFLLLLYYGLNEITDVFNKRYDRLCSLLTVQRILASIPQVFGSH